MADMVRPALIALACCVLLAATPGDARARAGLRLIAADGGALEIRNDGSAPVTFRTRLDIERREGRRWQGDLTSIRAIATCPDPGEASRSPGGDAAVVTLRPLQRLTVVRWLGYSCSKQCPIGCGFNLDLGPGPFRYVATRIPGGAKVRSAVFAMPHRPVR